MNMNQENVVRDILATAERDKKGDYRIYNYYKQYIEDLGLKPTEYEQVIRQLAEVLKV